MATDWWADAPPANVLEQALVDEGVTGLRAQIARSIYQQESGSGRNTTTSNAGARGGMQIIPATFNSVADKDWSIDDPVQNARAGVRYISQLFTQAGGDAELTAAGYYGGPGGMEKARKGVAVSDPRNPNAPTTLQYGKQVANRIKAEDDGADDWWKKAPRADASADQSDADRASAPVESSLEPIGRPPVAPEAAPVVAPVAAPAAEESRLDAAIASAPTQQSLYDNSVSPQPQPAATGERPAYLSIPTDGYAKAPESDARREARERAEMAARPLPTATVGSVARDAASSLLQVGPAVVEGIGQVARLATGDTFGKELTTAAKSAQDAIRENVGSERAQIQKARFERDMSDPNVSISDALLNNQSAMADMLAPSLGSALLPLGVARMAELLGGMGKFKTAQEAAAAIAKTREAAVEATIVAQNAGGTYSAIRDKGGDQLHAYGGAAFTVPFTMAGNKITGGGMEGAAARRLFGKAEAEAAGAGFARGIPGAMGREGGQEAIEQTGQYMGEALGAGEPMSLNEWGKQAAVSAVMGAAGGGAMHVATGGAAKPAAPTPAAAAAAIGAAQSVDEAIAAAQAATSAPVSAPAPTTPAAPDSPAADAQALAARILELERRGQPPEVAAAAAVSAPNDAERAARVQGEIDRLQAQRETTAAKGPVSNWTLENSPVGAVDPTGAERAQGELARLQPRRDAANTPVSNRSIPADDLPADAEPVVQNRDRATPASIAQMRSIAANPDYGRASISRDFANGAPVVAGGSIPEAQMGRRDVAIASDGRRIPVRYAIVEADAVNASHDVSGNPNAGFSAAGATRAIAGNGRVAGLQEAYASGTAQPYRAEMLADDVHGVDPAVAESLRAPVLVRVMDEADVSADIGDVSNTATNLALSPVEQARNDARRVALDDLTFDAESGEATPETVRRFVQSMPMTEQGALIDTTGQPTRQAVDRLNAAVFSVAYGNDALVRLYAQASDPEARLVLSALAQVAPKMARLEGAGALDIRPLVAQAAELAVNARRQGVPLTRAAQQLDMAADPAVAEVLALFARNPRSNKAAVEALSRAADFAYREATKTDTDMFGEVSRASRDDVLKTLRGTSDERTSAQDVEQPARRVAAEQDARGRQDERAGPRDGQEAQGGRPAEAPAADAAAVVDDLLGAAPSETRQRVAAERARLEQQRRQQRNAAPDEGGFTLGMVDANTGREVAPGQRTIDMAPAATVEREASHLHALESRLSHERARLASASTDKERALRQTWVRQLEREVRGEREFLGLAPPEVQPALSDDDLLAALDTEPAAAPVGKKPPARQSVAAARQAADAARADYFTPGNIVQGYGGASRVLAYTPPDAQGRWSVRVQGVERRGDGWADVGEPRTHRTEPEARQLKAGPIERSRTDESSVAPGMADANTGREVAPEQGGLKFSKAAAPESQPIAVITGAEVASEVTRDNAVEVARAWYRANLQEGPPAVRPGFGKVEFTGKGLKELRFGIRNDVLKARLLPAVRVLIEQGQYHGRETLNKPRKDDIAAFHFFSGKVDVGGQIVTAGVTVAEDVSGNLFYNVSHEGSTRWQNRSPQSDPWSTATGLEGLPADDDASTKRSMTADDGNVNLFVLDAAPAPRTPVAAIRAAIERAYGRLLQRLEQRGLVRLHQTQDEAMEAAAQARAQANGTSVEDERASLAGQVRNSAAMRLWTGARTVNDFLVPETDAYQGNTTGDLAYVPESASVPAGPLRVTVGVAAGTHQGRGLMHMADNAHRDPQRMPRQETHDLAENLMREAVAVMGNVSAVHNDGHAYIFVSQRDKKAIVAQWRDGFYSVISVRPFSRDPVGLWGNPEWRGRLTFPLRDTAAAPPSKQIIRAVEPHPDRSGQEVVSERFDLSAKPPEPKAPTVTIKKKRTIEIKRSADGLIQGFFDPATGRSFLIADHLTAETAPGVLMHEIGIHAASAGTLDEVHARALSLLDEHRGEAFYDDVRARMGAAGETSAEEAAAYLVEAYERDRIKAPRSVARWVRDFIAAVRVWLNRRGVLVGVNDLTAADIAAMARANARRMANEGVDRFETEEPAGVSRSEVGGDAAAETRRQFKDAERAYGGREAWQRAKDAARTKLPYGQWVQVRTPNFKAWFGNWEALRDLSAPDSATHADADSALQAIAGKPLTNHETGLVAYVNRDQRDKILSAAARRKSEHNGFTEGQHYAIASRTEELWRHAVPVGDFSDTKNNDANVRIKRFAAPIVIDGRTRYVTLLAKETVADADGHRIYTLEVHAEKTLRGTLDALAAESGDASTPTRSVDAIVDALNAKVNPETVSKAIGPATGEPFVVYHGTTREFDRFDSIRRGEKTGGADARAGFFFAENPNAADQFTWENGDKSGSIMPVYLALRNPLVSAHVLNGATATAAGRIIEQAEAAGHDGVIFENSDMLGHTGRTFVVFHPEQIKSATGNRGSFDGKNPDIRFSRAAAPIPTAAQPPLGLPAQGWEIDRSERMDRLIYELQDKHVDLLRVQQAIEKTGQAIDERFDARLAETNYHGRVDKRSTDFLKLEAGPLLKDMAAMGVTQNELGDYLLARHAPEANAQIARVNPNLPDGGAGKNSAGVLMTTRSANDYIANLPAARRDQLRLLAERVDAITRGTQRILIGEGLARQSAIDAWNATYQHYVPLHREDAEGDFSAHPQGRGFSVKGEASKRRTGSTREVTNILTHVLMQRDAAIVRAEKNRVATSLYGLALSHPENDFWTTIRPNMGRAAIEQSLVAMGVDAAAVAAMDPAPTIRTVNKTTGQVQDTPNPFYKNLPNALVLKVDGEDRVILFNENNERAMRLVRSLKNQDRILAVDVSNNIVARATRFMAAMSTQWNPVFGMVNLYRDVQGALVNLASTPLAGQQAKVLANLPQAIVGIARDIAGRERTAWSDLYQQFQDDGGKIGYRDMFADAASHAREVEAKLKRLADAGKLTPGRAAHAMLDLLDGFNTTLENSTRLAAYKVALDNGMSRPQAARLARELTVDFNRKGRAGREIGPLYAFFNAAVQGNARTLRTLASPKGAKIIAGGLALGVLQSLLLAAAGFDDDEITEFEKAHALIIPLGGKSYMKLPLPLGLHVLPNTGRVITDLLRSGGKNAGRKSGEAIGEMLGAFNPVGGGNVLTGVGLETTFAPSVLDPFFELRGNQDFAGRPIRRETFAGDTRPHFDIGKEGTLRQASGELYRGVAETLNTLSGGNAYKAGFVNAAPEDVRYVYGVVFGGVGREIEKTFNAATALARGEEVKPSQVPFGSRFHGEVDAEQVTRTRYFDTGRRIRETAGQMKRATDAGDAQALRTLAKEHPVEAALAKDYAKVQRSIGEMNTLALENVGNKQVLKRIDEARVRQMNAVNQAVKRLEQRAAAAAQ